MTFSGLNIFGVLIAFVVSFVSGGIWFGPKTFYPIWMKERGFTNGEIPSNRNKPALLFGGTAIGVLIQTVTVALIVTSLQKHNPNLGVLDGAGVGFALGVGIGMFAS